jgi:hypothetical protein
MERHNKHYEQMPIQPYAVMRQMGILEEYLLAAAIKYLMRAGRKKEGAQFVALTDLQKAASVLDDLLAEMEVPF